MVDYTYAHQVIVNTVRTGSEPLGLCLVSQDDSWPEKILQPSDLGLTSALCQWTNYARRQGESVGLKASDIVCPPCLAAFGFKKMADPEIYARFVRKAGYADCGKTALAMAGQLSVFPSGQYQGILAFPLKKAFRKPDAIWIYGSPAQLSHMVTGLVHQTGRYVHSVVGNGLSCRLGFSKAPSVVIPGRGERLMAGTDESELFLAIPETYLDDLVSGLMTIGEKGITGPFSGPMPYAMPLIPALEEMAGELTDP